VGEAFVQGRLVTREGPLWSSPPWLFVGVDAEAELADEFVGEQRVGGVDAAEAGVAEELLDAAALEDAGPSGEVEGGVDDGERAGDDVVLAGNDLGRPVTSVIDATRPVVAHPVEVGGDRLEVDAHLGDVVLDLRVVDDPFVLIAPPGVVPSGCVPTVDLDGRPLVGAEPCACQEHIDRGLRRIGVEPNYVFRTTDNAAMVAMVRAGMGMAVMPLLAVDIEDPTIAVRRLEPPVPERRILLCWLTNRSRSPLAVRLVEVAHELCAGLDERDLETAACA
jgi:hypothetical protein